MARKTYALLALTLGLAGAAATGAPATASWTCPEQRYVQPFLPWLDPARYVLLHNGSLESTYGWQLAGDAKLVTGNEPWRVNRSSDVRSLSLPAGASAISPALCVTLFHPTLRLFGTNSGAAGATLKIEAITEIAGFRIAAPVGLLTAAGWQPTVPLAFLENLASPVTGAVRFRFTAAGAGGRFQIDDVYVDPFKGT